MVQIYNFFHNYGLPAINLQRFSFIFIQCAKLFIFFSHFRITKNTIFAATKNKIFFRVNKVNTKLIIIHYVYKIKIRRSKQR